MKILDLKKRYNAWHKSSGSDLLFFLSEPELYIDECHILLLKVILCAARDVINSSLLKSKKELTKEIWETARNFLFNPKYYIQWGNEESTLEELLDKSGLETRWVRKKIEDIIKDRVKNKGKRIDDEEEDRNGTRR